MSVEDFLESDAGFVWLEVAGVRVYSCYFSTNDPLEVFETQILLLEESLSETVGRSLIGGDFNRKSPDFTFRRGAGGSIIDFENTSKKPGSLMSLVGSALLGRLKLLCARRG